MGIGGSRNRQQQQRNVPFPQVSQGTGGYPPIAPYPPYNISRPPSPMMPGMSDINNLNRRQQRQLEQANKTIQSIQTQLNMRQAGGMGLPPPFPPGSYSPPSARNSYPPPSPILQRLSAQYSYPQQQPMVAPPPPPQPLHPSWSGGYRDTDYAAVANIAGLNPTDIALLHREYLNLTRGGINKIDRVVFRQLLREAMVEANNENIDRAIENIFISIDKNHDGFIDFPEFIGAFRDILKGSIPPDQQNFLAQQAIPDLVNEQMRVNSFSPNIVLPQSSGQIISIPSSNVQQSPFVYSGASPLVISLDQNQSPYVQGQSSPLQCIPLPI